MSSRPLPYAECSRTQSSRGCLGLSITKTRSIIIDLPSSRGFTGSCNIIILSSPVKFVSFVSYPDSLLRKIPALLSCNFVSARPHRHLSPRHYRAPSVLTRSPGFALAERPIACPACLCLAHRLLLVPAGRVSASEPFPFFTLGCIGGQGGSGAGPSVSDHRLAGT